MDSADAAEMVAEVHEAEEEGGEASRTRSVTARPC